jgi:flagellar biosynthesis protein FlhA
MQRVLQDLRHRRVPIRHGVPILEARGETAPIKGNQVLLTEYVRQALRRMVVKPYANPSGDPPVHLPGPTSEPVVEFATEHTSHLNLPSQRIRHIQERIVRSVWDRRKRRWWALASSGSRYFPRQIVKAAMGNQMFLYHNEIPPVLKVVGLAGVQ